MALAYRLGTQQPAELCGWPGLTRRPDCNARRKPRCSASVHGVPFLRSRRGCVCSALSSSDGWEPLTLGGSARLAGGMAAGILVQDAAWSGWLQVLGARMESCDAGPISALEGWRLAGG